MRNTHLFGHTNSQNPGMYFDNCSLKKSGAIFLAKTVTTRLLILSGSLSLLIGRGQKPIPPKLSSKYNINGEAQYWF